MDLVERTQIKRARETKSALDSLRKFQSSPWLSGHRGPRVPLPQQSGSSKSHLKCPKWEIAAASPDSDQSSSLESSFLLEPTGFHKLSALSEHQQICQPQGQSSGAAEPGGRTSGTARWHAWPSWHPGTCRLQLRSAGAMGHTGTGRGSPSPTAVPLLRASHRDGQGRMAPAAYAPPPPASPQLSFILPSLGDELMSCRSVISS